MGGVVGVGSQVGFGPVAGVEHVGEGEGARAAAGDGAGRDVEDGIEGCEAVEVAEHGVDGGGVGVGLRFE